jgi:PatG Domain
MANQYVYALGTINPRFPNISLEKEFAQAASAQQTTNLTDRQIQYQVLSQASNRYIARDMCWIMTIENVDTYIVQPRTDDELTQLIAMLNEPATTPLVDIDVVIGSLGPIAPPEFCNGLQIPIVIVNNTYSFQVSDFISQIPKPASMAEATFQALVTQTLRQLMQLADNVGNLDEHRAVNYLALRYPRIYTFTIEQSQNNQSLFRVDVKMSRLNASGTRRIVDVIFTYRDNTTDIKTDYYVSADVSGMFPFLVEQLQPYYERPAY